MEFKPSTREDISRYYRGTYVKFAEFGDQLFNIQQVDSMKVVGTHESGDPFVLYLDEATPYNVEYILPHKSYFQLDNSAALLERIPAKMYYRGLCESNTRMTCIQPGSAAPKQLEINFKTLKQFVNKQDFFKLQQAINKQDFQSCVLTPRMMYHRGRKEIYIDHVMIAKVNVGKLTITLHRPVFMDEVKEFLIHTGEHNTFKVEQYVSPPMKEKLKPEDLVAELEGYKKAAVKKAVPAAPQFGQNLFHVEGEEQ
jgi:hypothetical protein